MLDQYDFLREMGFKGVHGLPEKAQRQIEDVVDLWIDLEGRIPRDRNMFHELFSQHSDKWFDHLKTARPDLETMIRGWLLENARIRHNEPARYPLRHIRRDWYGYAEDPRIYSAKLFILPIPPVLGLKYQASEEYSDRFAKTIWNMIGELGVFNYDILRLWPAEEFGVRDIDVRRRKACPAVIIATEKLIGEPKLKEFASVYGVTVMTSVGGKPSALSNWAVIKEFIEQMRRKDVPILLVTLADYDYDGIRMTHLSYKDHLSLFYPEVEHAMCGVFPFQIPAERLNPGDSLYELKLAKGEKEIGYNWREAIREGIIPEDMAPVEYEGEYYGIEMDVAGIEAFLPTIVEKLEEMGCTQDSWTDWAREQTLPDVDEVERGEMSSFAREIPEYKQLESAESKVRDERSRKVKAYDELYYALGNLQNEVRGKAEEELEGIADEIAEAEDFDDRGRPEPSTLTERVATMPLKPYEDYWDEETETGFSRDYLERKLRNELERRYEDLREDIEDKVREEMTEDIETKKDEVLELLEEIRTPSRVRY